MRSRNLDGHGNNRNYRCRGKQHLRAKVIQQRLGKETNWANIRSESIINTKIVCPEYLRNIVIQWTGTKAQVVVGKKASGPVLYGLLDHILSSKLVTYTG